MSTFGIQDIGVYIPDSGIDGCELGKKFNVDSEFIHKKLGFDYLRRKGSEQECSDLCVRAFEDLTVKVDNDAVDCDCVVVVTQNPDGGGIPHASAIVHRKLSLPSKTACFDVSLGCTGYVHGLSIICSFLEKNDMRKGLLFTSDPYSRVIDLEDRNSAMLFGDAASCTLISEQAVYCQGKTDYLMGSQYSQAIQVSSETGSLKMHGNQVFRFVAKEVPKQIRKCVSQNGLQMEDVDLFLVHQGSRYIVETLATSLQLPSEKVPFCASQVGNSVSSTLPLMLKEHVISSTGPANILMAGFGVGLSSTSTVLKRTCV